MALQHLRSSTANKRPTPAAMSDGQLAINTNTSSPGLFFKDSAGALIKVGPVHVGTTAPNASPASGGETGNTVGEQWLDTTGGTYVFKVWDGSAWRSEAGEFVNTTGDTMTGSLTMGASADIIFEGSVDDGFETTLTVINPTADRTITLPNVTGTVVTTGDSGTVTSTMIADSTIVNADVNASAAIAGTKIAPNFGSQTVQTTGIFSAAGGSASAPSIAFTGDTNTGIYSPGADQLAISTNGTGRLFVDSSGNVGVGVSSPQGTLSIEGEGRVVTIGDSGTANRPIIKSRNTTNDAYAYLHYDAFEHRFFDSGVLSSVNGQNTHVFYTSNNERLRITSDGKVGLGTSSPGALLDVAGNSGTTTPTLRISNLFNGTPTELSQAALEFYSGDVSTPAGASVRAKIDSLTNANGGGAEALRFFVSNSSGVLSEMARLTTTGRLGVGTTSPELGVIHVNQGSTAYSLNLQNNSSNESGIVFGRNTTPNASSTAIVGNGESTGHLRIATGGSERARIDSSGRLLVGTSTAGQFSSTGNTPQFQLNTSSSTTSSSTAAIFANSATNSPTFALLRNRATTAGGFDYTGGTVQTDDSLGKIEFYGVDGGVPIMRAGARIEAFCESTPTTTEMPTRLVFSTTADGASSPTEQMRIDNAGRILFNNISAEPNGTSVYRAAFAPKSNSRTVLLSATSSTASQELAIFFNPNGQVGSITVSGSATAYNTSSDYRLKENVTSVTDGITRLQQLKPSRFNFIADPDKTVDGFLAHEVQTIVPEAITGEKDAVDDDGNPVYQGIDQSKLVPLLTAALQEAVAKIESLEARLTAAGI